MKEIIIQENEANQRFDKFLGKLLNEAPKSFIYKMLRKKNIVLNGKKATGAEKLQVQDSVKVFLSEETFDKFSKSTYEKVDNQIQVVYEDENLLLVNKPAGLLSQKSVATDVSLVEEIISYLIEKQAITEESLRTFHPGICNRLDRNTSGLVVAGKTLTALQLCSQMFHDRTIHKYYLCLVDGCLEEKAHIKGYLHKNEKTNKVTIYQEEREDAKPIETWYEPIEVREHSTLLRVLLITGRTHQIRSHLSTIGHPIIGDAKYGSRESNVYYQKKYQLNHQLLHAWELQFPAMDHALHKVSEQKFYAPLPDDFQFILKKEKFKENINGKS